MNMKEIDPALLAHIETQILPRYRSFDRAHSTDHVSQVIERSLARRTLRALPGNGLHDRRLP